MIILIKWFFSALAIILAGYVVSGVKVASFWSALILVLVLGFLNSLIKPLLLVLTLPINILTLGLFTLVINALMILLASSVVKGFEVGGFWNALLFGLVLSVVQAVLSVILK
ncbi:MAG: phage holin family protein [bacterium]